MAMGSNILVIDDDAGTREALADILLRAGYRVTLLEDESPLASAKLAPDHRVAVVDYHLPSGNGVEVAARLKALNPGLRVVLISAELPQDFDLNFAAHVVDRFLAKPFSKDAILEVVAQLCHSESP